MHKQKIAIITACYNTPPELLIKHFLSVEEQGHDKHDVLHVVVDDCSENTETRSMLLHLCDNYKDKTVLIGSKYNMGPGAARNRAIQYLSRQPNIKYACLLDSDDYLSKLSLSVRRGILDDNNIVAVYGNKYTAKWQVDEDIDGEQRLMEVESQLENVPEFHKVKLFQQCYIPSCSVMFDWKVFLTNIGSFREDVRLCEDWLVWRKLALLGNFKKVDMPVYTQTLHGNNLTTNQEVLRNHAKDMAVTKADLDNWINSNMDKINL